MKKQDGASQFMKALFLSAAGISIGIGMVTVCAISPAELTDTKEFDRLENSKERLRAVMLHAAKSPSVLNCGKIRAACKSFINSVNEVESMPSVQDKDLLQWLCDLKQSAQDIMDKVA